MKGKNTPIFWVLLVTACILVVMSHSFYSANMMVKRHAPLMEAALKVKLEAAVAHLWFEEIISGDDYIDIERVWGHMDRAKWYANAMLHGGEDSQSVIVALKEPKLRIKVKQAIAGIDAFRSIAERRWAQQPASHVGSDIDQLFDSTFEDFFDAADGLVLAQKVAMNRELQRFSQIQTGLMLCVAILGIITGYLMLRYEKRKTSDIKALQESEDLLAKTQRMAKIGSWSQNHADDTVKWTQEACRILEIESSSEESALDVFFNHAHPDDLDSAMQAYNESLATQSLCELTYRLQFDEKRIKHLNLRRQTVYDNSGKPLDSVGSIQDITEQKSSEEALRHAQKMDSIGQLTGGIAHDFNNILAIILGNVSLLAHHHNRDENVVKRAATIEKSAQRAAVLTKQLLGLSRYQSSEIVAVSMNQTINQMMDLISRSLTPQIEVILDLSEDLWSTEIDPGEFQDALLNLIINARDAMDGRGRLTLRTRNHVFDLAYCSMNQNTCEGSFVMLSVSDTGEGIAQNLQPRLFEPFFTTKEQGKGTGLGLSMVYEFVKRSGGHIEIKSEPGRGSTFNIYFPFSEQQPKTNVNFKAEHFPKGHETILAVDDEIGILEVARASLEALGYKVLTANNGEQALQALRENSDIALLFSDVVMPGGMNGYELAKLATAKYNTIKVLLTSGYTEKTIVSSGLDSSRINILGKPYSRVDLAQRVRHTLDHHALPF